MHTCGSQNNLRQQHWRNKCALRLTDAKLGLIMLQVPTPIHCLQLRINISLWKPRGRRSNQRDHSCRRQPSSPALLIRLLTLSELPIEKLRCSQLGSRSEMPTNADQIPICIKESLFKIFKFHLTKDKPHSSTHSGWSSEVETYFWTQNGYERNWKLSLTQPRISIVGHWMCGYL
jgi:hypothetical protein